MEEKIQDKKNDLNKDKNIYKPVLVFFAKTTSWIIFPLIICILLGKYVGRSTGSQTLFFAFVMMGFGISCFGIYKEIKNYKKDLDKK